MKAKQSVYLITITLLSTVLTASCGKKKQDPAVAAAFAAFGNGVQVVSDDGTPAATCGAESGTVPLLGAPGPALSVARVSLASVANGSKLYFGGGFNYSSGTPVGLNTVDIYDTASGTWSQNAMGTGRDEPVAAAAGSKVLFADGDNEAGSVDVFNTTTATWSTASLSIGRSHLAAAGHGGQAFFAGGVSSGTISSVIDIYNDATGTWSTAKLSLPRYGMMAAVVGSKVMFAGGFENFGTPSKVVDIFDTTSSTWSTAALSQPRAQGAAASAGNQALFGGGVSTVLQQSVVAIINNSSTVNFDPVTSFTADIYDAAAGTWSVTTAPDNTHSFLSAVGVGSQIVFAGGSCLQQGVVPIQTVLLPYADVYHVSSKTWSSLSTLSQSHGFFAGAASGQIAVFAGGETQGAVPTAAVSVINGATLP